MVIQREVDQGQIASICISKNRLGHSDIVIIDSPWGEFSLEVAEDFASLM